MNIPFLVCKNYITSEKASFIIKKPSLKSIKDDDSQEEKNNDSQKNENSISNNLEIIDYPYYLNYREEETIAYNPDKLDFQNFKEFDDITDDLLSQKLVKDIIIKKSDMKKSEFKELDNSSSFKKNNQTIYRKILNNKKIIKKNNSPTNKQNNNFGKILDIKISKKENNKNNIIFRNKIENVTGIHINCPSPDSDKDFLVNHIHKYNSQISSKKAKKRVNLIKNSNNNSKSNQKVRTIKLKITSNFADFNKNKQIEKKDKKDQKENYLNFDKLSKNKNRTYNTLTINNKERILFKLKKIDKINNNVENNKSQKVKLSTEKKIINSDEFKNKKVLNIMPILKKEKSLDCIGRKKSKQHMLCDNQNNFQKINKIVYNNNYNTIHIINSKRNKKNNTVLNHISRIQNNNYSSRTYINPFDKKEKRVIKNVINLKNLNLNKTKKH